MKKIYLAVLFFGAAVFFGTTAWCGQSTISLGEHVACMGTDKSVNETESEAINGAKKNAAGLASTYIKSEFEHKIVSKRVGDESVDAELGKDLVGAYVNAQVKVLDVLAKDWESNAEYGKCCRVKVRAEIIPDESAIQNPEKLHDLDNPTLPLVVKVWANSEIYRSGELMKIYLRGNKPFYARVIYTMADGTILQLLPNGYRRDNYFNGGTMYSIPSGPDQFKLEVSPPFGKESLTVFASTEPLGTVDGQDVGQGLTAFDSSLAAISNKTRGIKIIGEGAVRIKGAAEFFETETEVVTGE
ncbi:MAG: DUF4384 domain-containing protein [Pseudomonadota bacterium]